MQVNAIDLLNPREREAMHEHHFQEAVDFHRECLLDHPDVNPNDVEEKAVDAATVLDSHLELLGDDLEEILFESSAATFGMVIRDVWPDVL